MSAWAWAGVVALALLIVIALIAWRDGARIDRMHRRIASTRLSLDRHLVRRSAEALRLCDTAPLTPEDAANLRKASTDALAVAAYPLASDTLGGFARQGDAAAGDASERLRCESELSAVLRRILTTSARNDLSADPLVAAQIEVLDNATYRARVARNLHNQDVSHVRRLRAQPLPRFLHLAGRAPLPEFVDLDDQ